MNVICLNWNDYLGRGAEYVNKLRNAVRRHLTIPHDFVVVTEKELPPGRQGWFNKLSLFDMFHGETLFLDLDVVITSNIDHLVALARSDYEKVWMRDDFSYSVVNPRPGLDAAFKRVLGGDGCCNSSVMLWEGNWHFEQTDDLLDCHGDQNVISAELWNGGFIGLLPNNSIKSWKYHPGEIAPIVVFHGQPKPHEVCGERMVQEHWR